MLHEKLIIPFKQKLDVSKLLLIYPTFQFWSIFGIIVWLAAMIKHFLKIYFLEKKSGQIRSEHDWGQCEWPLISR